MPKPDKIIIAYRTRPVPGAVADMTGVTPPANYKDPAKIDAWLIEKKEQITQQLSVQPYTATFDEVLIMCPKAEEMYRFAYREPGANRPSVESAIRNCLLKLYPNGWQDTTHPDRETPEAIFVGFKPRIFLKILGTACSLPANNGKTLPYAMWQGNSDHRDIEEAAKPDGYAGLTWPLVFAARGMTDMVKDWQGPGVDVSLDLKIITMLASQLGM